ncbi:hypothetical protein [Streptomyces sp. NPDC000410]|uniref:hypothetical protein n=1 Tax=Streptomyces sp. NPDC000410 TaxID=3154254 RepID=UPI003331E938
MTGHRFRARALACSAALITALAAAGGAVGATTGEDIEQLTARQISEKAKKALLSAKSLHITTKGNLDDPEAATELDLTLDREGNCAGSVSTGGKGSVEIIKRGETVWMKPDEAFWKSQVPGRGEAAAKLFKDRYLRGTTDDSMLRGMAEVCDLDGILKSVTGSSDIELALTKGRKTKVDGVEAIPLTGKRAERTMTLYVATEGKPYPVRLNATVAGEAEASIAFSDYDEPVPSTTPPADKSVDLSTLTGQSD